MRKVLSLVLVLALVLGSFSMAFAATPTDVVGTPSETAVSVLMDLGVVSGYTDGSYKPAGIVTRAEMAKLIVAALGLSDYATGTTTKFPDMAGATWAQGYVSYATGLGIVSGYPDGTFKPSQTVSYPEAASMIVRALGYTQKSLLPATWPANFVVKAKALGLFDDVSKTTGGATRGDIALMIYAALGLPIGTVDADNKWTASNSGTIANPIYDTMLARLSASLKDKAVILGNEDSAINLRAFVGAYAKTYLNGDGDIIVVLPSSTFLTGKFNTLGTVFTADDVDYNVSTKAYNSLNTPTTTAISFYNGVETTRGGIVTTPGNIYAKVDGTFTLAVDLSGKTIKDAYSIAKWSDADTFQFDADYKAEIADDQTLFTHKFILDDNDKIDLSSFELLGAANLEAITTDNVVAVYADKADKIRKIEVGTATAKGEVTKVNATTDVFTIGGKSYDLAADKDSTPTLGDTGTAYLNYAGEIFAWKVESASTGNYAIVADYTSPYSIAFGDTNRIQLLDKAGDKVTFTVDSDAITATSYAAIGKGDLVEYSTDKNGVIDSLTKVAWDTSATTTHGAVSVSGSVYAGKAVSTSVVIFTYKDGYATPTGISTLADIKDSNLVNNVYYHLDGTKIDVMYIDSTEAGQTDTVYAVFNSISKEQNADGDQWYVVAGFANGKAYTARTVDLAVLGNWATAGTDAYKIANGDNYYFTLTLNAAKEIKASDDNGAAYDVTSPASALVWTKTTSPNTIQLVNALGNVYAVDPAVSVYEYDTTATDVWALKSFSSVKKDVYVKALQMDKDSEGIDLILIDKALSL